MKPESEDEFYTRIEREVGRICAANPGTDPEEIRKRLIFLERLDRLDPITMSNHIHTQASSYIPLLHDPEVTVDQLKGIAGQLMFGVTTLAARIKKMVEEDEQLLIIPSDGSVH